MLFILSILYLLQDIDAVLLNLAKRGKADLIKVVLDIAGNVNCRDPKTVKNFFRAQQ